MFHPVDYYIPAVVLATLFIRAGVVKNMDMVQQHQRNQGSVECDDQQTIIMNLDNIESIITTNPTSDSEWSQSKKAPTIMVALHMSKAFDTVSLCKLLNLFNQATVADHFEICMSNYLQNRQIHVDFIEVKSKYRKCFPHFPCTFATFHHHHRVQDSCPMLIVRF